MNYILAAATLFSIITACFTGRIKELSAATISECGNAVTITLTLLGTLCLWSGLMKVAEKSGITTKLAALLSPITCRLFKGIDKASKTMQLITMNITANILGLGNAATPMGLEAMQELAKDCPDGIPSDNMLLFTVLNTASIQVIPTTAAVLRQKYNSDNPFDIIPCVIITSLASVTVSLFSAKLLNRRRIKK